MIAFAELPEYNDCMMNEGNAVKMNYRRKNPVARVLNRVNRPQTHREKTQYRRREKFQTQRDWM
jgi:hypothetical protein